MQLPVTHYPAPTPVQVAHVSSASPMLSLETQCPYSSLQQGVSLEEISQYYIFPDRASQQEHIVFDPPLTGASTDPEFPLSGHFSSLQTIYFVQEVGKPNYLSARVPVPMHWDLNLLESLLGDYDDPMV